MICPDCQGSKESFVLAHMVTGECKPKIMNCFRCKGSGEVSDEMWHWVQVGKGMRAKRLDMNFSMKEMAGKLGIDLLAYNDAEHGKLENSETAKKFWDYWE